MKKKVILFSVLTAALALGAATFAIVDDKKEAQPLDAEAYNAKTSAQNGLFVKVTDVNSIQTMKTFY